MTTCRTLRIRRRTGYENELIAILEKEGYTCLRSAGSRGPADIVAIGGSSVRVIQVKSTKDIRTLSIGILKQAVADLAFMPSPPGCIKEVWIRILRDGWRYLLVNDAPKDIEKISEYLKHSVWMVYE